jgi:hypothetical protein
MLNRSHRPSSGVTSPDNISRCKAELDITEAERAIVTALISAAVVGLGPRSARQLSASIAHLAPRGLKDLQRRLWVEPAGKVEKTREQLWRPTTHAFRRLGLQGWEVKLHTEEELAELRATMPSVTLGFSAPIKVLEEERVAS